MISHICLDSFHVHRVHRDNDTWMSFPISPTSVLLICNADFDQQYRHECRVLATTLRRHGNRHCLHDIAISRIQWKRHHQRVHERQGKNPLLPLPTSRPHYNVPQDRPIRCDQCIQYPRQTPSSNIVRRVFCEYKVYHDGGRIE